jgi:hypothetical protein
MWDRQGGHRIPALEATDDLWDQALSALRAGAVEELRIYLDRLGADGFPDAALGGASLVVRIPAGEGVGDACEIVVSADLPLFGRTISSSVQEYFVSLLRRTAVTARASTEYITLDASPDPYERRYGLNGTQGSRSSGTRLRGYYWANILSERHIQALGGMDEIRTQAPCHVVEDLSDGRETLAYLQLTPDLNRFDDEKLRALRDYLSTLLTVEQSVSAPSGWCSSIGTSIVPGGPPIPFIDTKFHVSSETFRKWVRREPRSTADSAQPGANMYEKLVRPQRAAPPGCWVSRGIPSEFDLIDQRLLRWPSSS